MRFIFIGTFTMIWDMRYGPVLKTRSTIGGDGQLAVEHALKGRRRPFSASSWFAIVRAGFQGEGRPSASVLPYAAWRSQTRYVRICLAETIISSRKKADS